MTEPLYRIGEAARLLELETYVLRFWETEFSQLEPLRTPKGQRLYTAVHLDLLRRVKSLLYDDGLTIDGARKALAREINAADPQAPPEPLDVMRPAKPARFAPGALRPPASEAVDAVVADVASRRLLQELRLELYSLQALARTPAAFHSPHSSPTTNPNNEEPPA